MYCSRKQHIVSRDVRVRNLAISSRTVFSGRVFTTESFVKDMRGSRGIGGLDPPPLKNHKNIGFRSNTGPDP